MDKNQQNRRPFKWLYKGKLYDNKHQMREIFNWTRAGWKRRAEAGLIELVEF